MSKTVHVVSVGGSAEPIITSVQSRRPDRVVFFCSSQSRKTVDGLGKPCEVRANGVVVEKRPSIVGQLRLENFDPQRDVVEVGNPDDLDECYRTMSKLLTDLVRDDADVTVDYTGGTKTMSVAALDFGTQLVVTSGPRTDLVKVSRGAFTERAESSAIQIERLLYKVLPRLLEAFDYSGACRELESALTGAIGNDYKATVRLLVNWTRALDAWDCFDHLTTIDLFELYRRHPSVRGLLTRVQAVAASRAALDDSFDFHAKAGAVHGYEILEDLFLNARRRATQGRFDDAVGRLYRALELLAQLRLRFAHSIKTGEVHPDQVPETHRAQIRFEGPTAKLGLFESYGLLTAFPDDPLGRLFTPEQGSLRNALQARNSSLFAHGFTPVTREAYKDFEGIVGGFLERSLAALVAKGTEYHLPEQMPTAVPPELLQNAAK